MTTTQLPTTVTRHQNDGGSWTIESTRPLTNAEAQALTFQWSRPEDVVLGAFVEVVDPGGIRIGRLDTAHYQERWGQAPVVIVTIDLR